MTLTIDKWLMQGLLTSILTGVGFLVISFTIEYVKRFRKGRQAREQEIFLQRILCGERVLEWSNGKVRAKGKKDCVLGPERSAPRGQQLFEQYKRAGGFLGVGQGYYSRLAEAQRRVAECLQDKSMTAVVSRTSWAGGPASRAQGVTSSTSVDDELTSLEWDLGSSNSKAEWLSAVDEDGEQGDHFFHTYRSPTSIKSGNSSSNGNNMSGKTATMHGIRLWSTQQDKENRGEVQRENAPEIGADLCARALREHPHLAPFLRQDVLEKARAVEVQGAQKTKRRGKSPKAGRSLERSTGVADSTVLMKARGKSTDRLGLKKSAENKETIADSKISAKSDLQSSKDGTKRVCNTLFKRNPKTKEEKTPNGTNQRKAEVEKSKENSDCSLKVARRGRSLTPKGETIRRDKSQASRPDGSLSKKETGKSTKRESSSTSVKSLPPSRRKSSVSQASPRISTVSSERVPGVSKSQTTGLRRSRRNKTSPSVKEKACSSGNDSGQEEDPDSNPITWPCGKSRETTAVEAKLRYRFFVEAGSAQSHDQEKSISSSVDYKYASFEEKTTYKFAEKSEDFLSAVDQTTSGTLVEEENKDAVSSSISGYIRKLVFGESVGHQDAISQPTDAVETPVDDDKSHMERHNILMPNSPMTTIEEAPFGSASRTVIEETLPSEAIPLNSYLDEEIKTDTESGVGLKLPGQVSASLNTNVHEAADTCAKTQEQGQDKRLLSQGEGSTASSARAKKASAYAGCKKTGTVSSVKPGIKMAKPPSPIVGGKKKNKKKNGSASPAHLTQVKSRASSFSSFPELKAVHPILRRSLSHQDETRAAKDGLNTSELGPRKLSKKREASRVGIGTAATMRRTNSNIEHGTKPVTSKFFKQSQQSRPLAWSSQQKRARPEKLKLADSKQNRKATTESVTPKKSKGEKPSQADELAISERSRSNIENAKIKPDPTPSVENKSPKLAHHRKSKIISNKPSSTKANIQTPKAPKPAAKEEKTLSSEEGFNYTRNKGVEAKAINISSALSQIKPKTIEKPYVTHISREKQNPRRAASKMLDNYDIEVKREEVLGAVVSLVTYHPKNGVENTQKNSRSFSSSFIDHSENCKQDSSCSKDDKDIAIQNWQQNKEKGTLKTADGQTLGQKAFPEPGNFSKMGDPRIPCPSNSGSSLGDSKHTSFSESGRNASSIDLDTDSESELTYTSKYGSYSLRLHDADVTRKRADRFKAVIDAPKIKPFAFRPSTLDGVVKSVGLQKQNTTLEEHRKSPTSFQRSPRKINVSPTAASNSFTSKALESLSLDLGVAVRNSKKQSGTYSPQQSKNDTFAKNPQEESPKQLKIKGEATKGFTPAIPSISPNKNKQMKDASGSGLTTPKTSPGKGSGQKDGSTLPNGERNANSSFIKHLPNKLLPPKIQNTPSLDTFVDKAGFSDGCKDSPSTSTLKTPETFPPPIVKTENGLANVQRTQKSPRGIKDNKVKNILSEIIPNAANSPGVPKTLNTTQKNKDLNKVLTKQPIDTDADASSTKPRRFVRSGLLSGKQTGKNQRTVTSQQQATRTAQPGVAKTTKEDKNEQTSDRVSQIKSSASTIDRKKHTGNKNDLKVSHRDVDQKKFTLNRMTKPDAGQKQNQDNGKHTSKVKEGKNENNMGINLDKQGQGTNKGEIKRATSPCKTVKTDKKSPVRRQTLVINKSSPMKLHDLDSGGRRAMSEKITKLKPRNIPGERKQPAGFAKKSVQETNTPSNKNHGDCPSNANLLIQNTTSPTKHNTPERQTPLNIARKEILRPPVLFQTQEVNKNKPVRFQKLCSSTQNSLASRQTFPNENASSITAKIHPSAAETPSFVAHKQLIQNSLGAGSEHPQHIFGGNTSFAINSFQEACSSHNNFTEPKAKVDIFAFAGNHFQAYRQRKDSDCDD